MTKTNKKRCLLASYCRLAGGQACNNQCSAWVAMHGIDGAGGRVGASNLPHGYKTITLDNSPARQAQERLYSVLDGYTATFKRQFEAEAERIKSWYLWSNSPGTGKTTTASALLNAWLVAHYLGSIKRGKQPMQRPAYFLDVNEWQTYYNEFNRPRVPDEVAENAATKYYASMEKAKQAPFAVLDDIGVRDCSEGFRGDLHTIINHRTVSEMPTIYTSNLPIEDMARVFDSRLYDRMRDQCGVAHFAGESKRGRR